MRKGIAISFALLMALCGCQKLGNIEDRDPVTFSAVRYSLQSKAETTVAFPTTVDLGVFAWKSSGAWADEASPAGFMTNVQASYDEGVWKPVGSYRWPKSGYLHFFCYSPYKADSPFTCTKSALSASSYSVGATATEDLCYSDITFDEARADDEDEPAAILMRHALCKVSFNVEAAEIPDWLSVEKVVIQDGVVVTFSNIRNQGSFSAAAASEGKWTAPEWSSLSGAAAFTIDAEHNGLLLMPQTLTNTGSGDQQFRVQCTATVTLLDAETKEEKDIELSIDETHPLYTASCTAWGVNQHIVYNLSLNIFDGDITFSPALANWDDDSATIKIGYEDPLI